MSSILILLSKHTKVKYMKMNIEVNDENVVNMLDDLVTSVVVGNLTERLNDLKIEQGLRASGHEKCGMFDHDLERDLELIDILVHSYQNVINDLGVPHDDSNPKMP